MIHTPNSSANTALTSGRSPASTCGSSSSAKISSPRCDFSFSSSSGSTPMTKRLSTCACVVRKRVGGFASRTSRRTVSISRYALDFSSSRASSAACVSPRMRDGGLRGDLIRLRAPSRHVLEDVEERVDHLGVELAAAAALELRQALRVGERGLVGAAARHGVVGVDHGHGAGQGRDGVAGEAVGVAVAVVALVVVPHGEHEVLGEERADDVGAHHRVLAHLLPLLLVQAAGLEEHPVGDADLADVVEVRRLLERRQHVLLPAQLVAQHHRVGGDPGGVAERVVVLGVQRRAQGLEVAEVHALDLVVELRVLDRQGELRADALRAGAGRRSRRRRDRRCSGRGRRGGRRRTAAR